MRTGDTDNRSVSLTSTAVYCILQPIAGVLSEVKRFRIHEMT